MKSQDVVLALLLSGGVIGLGAFAVRALFTPVKVAPLASTGIAPAAPSPLQAERQPLPGVLGEVLPADDPRAEFVERNNRAIEALEAERFHEAVSELDACLGAFPEDEVFRANLAEALARRARWRHDEPGMGLALAIPDLERAVELAPEREELAPLLERWRREAQLRAAFAQYDSLQFELVFDGGRQSILEGAQRVIDTLEEAYFEYYELFGVDPVRENERRLRVALYTPEEFREVTGLGHWAGGAFDGTVKVPVEDFDRDERRWRETLRHELLHAFVREVGGRDVPGWLNEGLAQHLEGERSRQLALARGQVAGSEPLPLAELTGSLGGLGTADRIRTAYAQSLLFVDFLERHYGAAVLVEMVCKCRESTPEATFEARLGVPLAEAHGFFLQELRG
jgi:tetratricopeptide (TPR) repeat protein